MTCEEEEQMLKKAFEKGIVRIATTELLDWHKADSIAKEFAGGLCKQEDFINADLKYAENFDHIVYAEQGSGCVDAIQLGGDPNHGEFTFSSVVNKHKNAKDYCTIRAQDQYKQMDHIFAKRCEKKNQTYIPKDFTQENELYAQYKTKKVFDETCRKQSEPRNKFQNFDQQNEMMKNAFDKNIIKIETEDKCLNYEQAKELAQDKALRLPTLEELQNSGVIESDDMDFFAFVQRPDNKPDAVQMGKGHETVKERFWSHLDKLGEASWLNDNEPIDFRPLRNIYALKCPKKNGEFVPQRRRKGKK